MHFKQEDWFVWIFPGHSKRVEDACGIILRLEEIIQLYLDLAILMGIIYDVCPRVDFLLPEFLYTRVFSILNPVPHWLIQV